MKGNNNQGRNPEDRENAAKAFLEGRHSVKELTIIYGVTRAAIYQWIKAYKIQVELAVRRRGMTEIDLEKCEKAALVAELKVLKRKYRELQERWVASQIEKAVL